MAYRGMSASMQAEIVKQNFRVAHLAQIYFSTTVYITDAGFDLSYGGHTYADTVGLIGLDSPGETFDFSIGTMSFTLSGTELANLSIALTENFTDDRFVLYRALLDSSNSVIADPVLIWDGRIDNWDFSEQPETGESSLKWNTSNHWVDFNRTAGRRANDSDQQLFYPGDTGLQYAGQGTVDLKWPA